MTYQSGSREPNPGIDDRFACPLCDDEGKPLFKTEEGREYVTCSRCGLVWMTPEGRLSLDDEKAHYDTHENSPEDLRYRRFLDQLWQPLKSRLNPNASGLDYGSGPGPTLHLMAREDGFDCEPFDPFFAPDWHRLEQPYDFITCSETAEHFHRPREQFKQLHTMLNPGGWLGLMTQRLSGIDEFPSWFYHRDPTHVCFYQDGTFKWIA